MFVDVLISNGIGVGCVKNFGFAKKETRLSHQVNKMRT